MNDFFKFADFLDGLVQDLDSASNDKKKKAADFILRELVYATPVDTSRALSNWQVGVGTTPGSTIQPYFSGAFGSTQAASAEAAIREGSTVIRTAKTGQPIHLTNNLDYIAELNNGSSRQAPAGFVQVAVRRAALQFGVEARVR